MAQFSNQLTINECGTTFDYPKWSRHWRHLYLINAIDMLSFDLSLVSLIGNDCVTSKLNHLLVDVCEVGSKFCTALTNTYEWLSLLLLSMKKKMCSAEFTLKLPAIIRSRRRLFRMSFIHDFVDPARERARAFQHFTFQVWLSRMKQILSGNFIGALTHIRV